MTRLKHYRVTPGTPFRLADIDPAETLFLPDKEQHQQEALEGLAEELDHWQNLLHAEGRRKLLLVLQGTDTSGKDGTIRWVFSRTSPLGVRVAAFKAPTDEERARDFLWRCHAVVPRAGEIAVWNRSHYEDVLVPWVEGWIGKAELRRRYAQINDFERLLTETGTVVVKCMLHIDKDEQRKRLQARLDDPGKHWKFSLGDLATRQKWDNYQHAYERAITATSTAYAPWYIVPANHKNHRNLMIARLLIKVLRDMKISLAPANPAFAGLKVQ